MLYFLIANDYTSHLQDATTVELAIKALEKYLTDFLQTYTTGESW